MTELGMKKAERILQNVFYDDMTDKEIKIVSEYETEKHKSQLEAMAAEGKGREEMEDYVYSLWQDYSLCDEAESMLYNYINQKLAERDNRKNEGSITEIMKFVYGVK